MLLNCGVREDSWESLGLQGDPTSPFWRRSALGFLWKEWCWSWNSNTLATWCKELTPWKRPWYWERLKAGGEGDDRGWDGWMASPTRWPWVWASSGSWWWTEKPDVLQSMGSQIVGHVWETELTDTGMSSDCNYPLPWFLTNRSCPAQRANNTPREEQDQRQNSLWNFTVVEVLSGFCSANLTRDTIFEKKTQLGLSTCTKKLLQWQKFHD